MESIRRAIHNYNKISAFSLIGAVCLFLSACQPVLAPNKLNQLQETKTLKVGILFNPSSYYIDNEGPAGFEYDLVQAFGDYTGVKIELVPSYHVAELLPKLRSGQVDMLVGGLAVTQARSEHFRYSPPY